MLGHYVRNSVAMASHFRAKSRSPPPASAHPAPSDSPPSLLPDFPFSNFLPLPPASTFFSSYFHSPPSQCPFLSSFSILPPFLGPSTSKPTPRGWPQTCRDLKICDISPRLGTEFDDTPSLGLSISGVLLGVLLIYVVNYYLLLP